MSRKWAIIGLGFISQRHLDAIKDIGDELIVACDIDKEKSQKVPAIPMFLDWEEMMESALFEKVDWVAICTPNYLHYPMIKKAIAKGKKVLCEKPLVISLQHVQDLEQVAGLYTVLQLRHNKELQKLRHDIQPTPTKTKVEGNMNINMHRGEFYQKSWKINRKKSGGLLYNIGIHYFDLLYWLFGQPTEIDLWKATDRFADGSISFENAKISWHISINAPMDNQVRHLIINGETIDLTRNFENLHTKVYQDIVKGLGIPPTEAKKSIEIVEEINRKSQ